SGSLGPRASLGADRSGQSATRLFGYSRSERTLLPARRQRPATPQPASSMRPRKTSYPASTRTLLCCRGEHGERPEHLGRGRERLREGALGVACHTIVKTRDYVFTEYAKR